MENQGLSGLELINIVDEKIKNVRTRSLDISFNELLDMYENGELIIDPEYQRLFRWSEGTQSRFIESLLLELPIPPIFVIEHSEGTYELLDGLQRISSYMHFRGRHPERRNDDGSFHELELSDCDIVEALIGSTYKMLPAPLQIKLRRNFIRVEVIRKESDPRLRYYMFKRLNTGGETLSYQEARNCIIRILGNRFVNFIIELSKNEDFCECISNVSDEKIKQKYDQELVLRFFAFKNYRKKYLHDVQDFMTEYMENVSDEEKSVIKFNYEEEKEIFEKTFKILNATLGSKVFSGTNKKGNLVSKFLSYHYEVFAIGIQKYLNCIEPTKSSQIDSIRNTFLEIKNDSEFKRLTTGGGKNYAKQLQERISFVETKLGAILE